MRDCKNCEFYDGFVNFICSACPTFHEAIEKTSTFREEMLSNPTASEIEHFRQLWGDSG